MAEEKDVFGTLNSIDVKGHIEKKNGLSYLPWSYAWGELKKRFPKAVYEVKRFNGLPYVFDPNTGYMVFTSVTIEGITHEMWLPVMDYRNRAMKDKPYTDRGSTVNAANTFDINKTIMRCLVKNIAMFGLGLYIFNGEDMPEAPDEGAIATKPRSPTPPVAQSPTPPAAQSSSADEPPIENAEEKLDAVHGELESLANKLVAYMNAGVLTGEYLRKAQECVSAGSADKMEKIIEWCKKRAGEVA